jgi:nucleoside-diphosphate-sugar epimerase
MHCHNNNNNTMILVDGGKAKRQPVNDLDIVKAVTKIIGNEESKGQIYELGGSQVYTLKELFEFVGNNFSQRPFYINYSYDEFMRLYLAPNMNWEKAAHWLLIRPDYLTKQRIDNILTAKEGVKTFKDLDILPLATHHYLSDITNWLLQKVSIENETRRDWAEIDADDEGH